MSASITRAWLHRGILACALWPLSILMGLVVAIRRWAYHRGWTTSVRLPAPVLVVGNRIVGGAGKTPTTIAILAHLKARGLNPGVLTRGYKASAGDSPEPLLLDAQTAPSLHAQETGDEPLLIWRRTGVPLMIHRDRALAGKALLRAHPEVDILVCDDGLQHLRLERDIEVVVFDERGAGNGWLLPAGPLREPITAPAPPGLASPPIVLYNADRPSTGLPGHLAQRRTRPLQTLEDWWGGTDGRAAFTPQQAAGRSVCALAGIASPQRFFEALRQQGFEVQGLPLPDHADLATLPWPAHCTDLIVTEKDAVKLDPARVARERPATRIWVAALDFEPEPGFWVALDDALARLPLSDA